VWQNSFTRLSVKFIKIELVNFYIYIKESKLSVFVNFLNDAKKQYLSSDKFIQSLNEEGIIAFLFLIKINNLDLNK
jgi:hypothetical protein